MPRPDNPGGGGGNGGGGGGDSYVFAVLGLLDESSSDSGVSQTDELTNIQTGFTIEGTVDPSIVSFTIRFTMGEFVFVGTVDTIEQDGTWSYTYPGTGSDLLPEGTVLVEAEYEEVHKNGRTKTVSAESHSFEIDITPDVEITSAEQVSGDLLLSGNAEAGAEVAIYSVDGSETLLGTTTADASGAWRFTDASYTDGDASYIAKDAAGNLASEGNYTYSDAPSGTNAPPEAVGDAVSTDEDNAVTVSVLSNDTDADGDPLTVDAVTSANNGSVSLNPNGTITYTPNADFNGTDSFTYTVSDDNGGTDTATVTVTVNSVNDDPVAQNDTATTNEDNAVIVDVLANDSDVEGDPLTVTGVTNGANGNVSINGDGTITYAPNPDFNGSDSFTYTISDGNGGSSSATVTVTVDPMNDAPVAAADNASTEQDTAVTIDVLANDTDPDGDTLTVTGTGDPAHGIVVVNADNTITYTPDAEYLGDDSFTYTVSDGNGGSDTVTVAVSVTEPPSGSVDTTDEPLYTDQWHLGYVGDIETIWQEFSGWGVSVGVYDNGVDYTHPDLFDNYDASKHVIVNGEVLDPAPSETVTAEHGTAVSGVIAAVDNDQGGLGVAPNASLTGVNIFGGPADINGTDVSGFSEAVNQAYTFDVVNNSWGTVPNFNHENDPAMLAALAGFETAALTGRGGLGTIVVKAAGNDYDSSQEFLNASRYTVTVAAHDEDGDASWYTNRGANLLVSAPSSGSSADADSGILTTDEQGSEGYAAGNYTYGFGGTSSAAPVVSGVVAMMLDANPNLGARDVQTILAYSAHILGVNSPDTAKVPADSDGDGTADTTVDFPVEFFDWFRTGADNWNGGGLHFSEDYGYGGVDAYNAVRIAEVWSLFGDPQTFGTAQQGGNEVIFAGAAQTPGLAYDNTWVAATYAYPNGGPQMDLEYVEVYVDFKAGGGFFDLYGNMEDTSIELVSPSGTAVSLMQGSDGYDSTNNYLNPFPDMDSGGQVTWTYGVNAFRGEDITGDWTLRIVDIGDDLYDGGVLNEFQITFYGAAPDDNDVYHYTDEFFAELALDPSDQSRKYLSDSGGTDDWLNMAAMAEDLTVDLAAGTASGAIGGTIIEDGAQDIENVVTGDGNDHLTGSAADNELHGMRGNDTLDGGLGDDIQWGGLGDDLFVFYPGDGSDLLNDFTAGASTDDVVALYGFGGLTFDTLNFTDIEGDTLLDLGGGDTITFAGLSLTDLHQDDFSFPTLV